MIATYSGKLIDPLCPLSEDIVLEDIAHGLSLACRYAGQCMRFYSVAEHCILMAKYDFLKGDVRAKLLHDAAEAYIGDIIRDIKVLLPKYKAIERKFMRVIEKRFDLSKCALERVKEADNIMLVSEARILMPKAGDEFAIAEPDDRIKLQFFSPVYAEQLYLDYAREIL